MMNWFARANTSFNKTNVMIAWNGICLLVFAAGQEFWGYQASATFQAAIQGVPSVLIPLFVPNKPPDAPAPSGQQELPPRDDPT